MSNPKAVVELSSLAGEDLDDILQYTLETWGAAQMHVYAARLQGGLQSLQDSPGLGKIRDDWFPVAVATRSNIILCCTRSLKTLSVSPGFFIGAWTRPVIFDPSTEEFQTVTACLCVAMSRRKHGAVWCNAGRAFR